MTLDDEIWDIYWHSRHAFHAGDIKAATAMYRRLRAEHAIDLYYEVDLRMPTQFVHPLGTVLGRAAYAPNLVVYQNVGVGSDLDGNRPVFTGPCVLFPGAKVLGQTKIGKNVFVTANTVVQGCEVPDNSVVFPPPVRNAAVFNRNRSDASLTCFWKPTTRSVVEHFF